MRSDGRCRSCGQPIRWAVHETTGRRMPLDAAPTEAGNICVVDWQPGTTTAWPIPVIAVNDSARAITDYRYTSHFATCPNADQHRRKP